MKDQQQRTSIISPCVAEGTTNWSNFEATVDSILKRFEGKVFIQFFITQTPMPKTIYYQVFRQHELVDDTKRPQIEYDSSQYWEP